VLIKALTKIWDHLTFEDVHAVFSDWMKRLSWVINNNEEYYIKSTNWIWNCFHRRRERGVVRTFCPPEMWEQKSFGYFRGSYHAWRGVCGNDCLWNDQWILRTGKRTWKL
jgi:hypothetical protein